MTITTVTATTRQDGIANFSTGKMTGDGNVTTVNLGFVPRNFKLWNITDVIFWEKTEGMAATTAFKLTNGPALTADTGSHILINTDGTVTLDATAIPNAKVMAWEARA